MTESCPRSIGAFPVAPVIVAAIVLSVHLGCGGTGPGDRNRSGAGGLAAPSNGSFLVPIIKELELDTRHGLDFDINLYSDPSILYSEFATKRITHIFGAIYNAANFYIRGLDIQLLFTISTANHAFVSANAELVTAADLRSRTVAATTSSGFYGMAVLSLSKNGIDPRRNLNVLPGSPALVQTQLLLNKVDAGLLFEPALSNVLLKDFHIVGDMNQDIRRALNMPSDAPLWYLGAFAHRSWIAENPGRAVATLRMWQAAAEFYAAHPVEADRMINGFTRVPAAALHKSRAVGLTSFRVAPAITERAHIDPLLEGFRTVGFLRSVPDADFYYQWPEAAARVSRESADGRTGP